MDPADAENKLMNHAPEAAGAFNENGPLHACAFFLFIGAMEAGIGAASFFKTDGTLWTVDDLTLVLDSIRESVIFPVRPLRIASGTNAAPNADVLLNSSHRSESQTNVPSLKFTTLYMLFRVAATGAEACIAVRRLERPNNIDNYVMMLDLAMLFKHLKMTMVLQEYIRQMMAVKDHLHTYMTKFHVHKRHFNPSAKSKRYLKDTTPSVAGVASGTLLFTCVLFGFVGSRRRTPNADIVMQIFKLIWGIVPLGAADIVIATVFANGKADSLMIRRGRVNGFAAFAAGMGLSRWLKDMLKKYAYSPHDNYSAWEVLFLFLNLPDDAHANAVAAGVAFLHQFCRIVEKSCCTSPMLLTERPLGHDGDEDEGHYMKPDKTWDVYHRFLKKGAGTIARAMPDDMLEKGARACNHAAQLSARHVAKCISVVCPLIENACFRGDVFVFDESRVGKQQILLVHTCMVGLFFPLPLQILPDADVDEGQTIKNINNFAAQAECMHEVGAETAQAAPLTEAARPMASDVNQTPSGQFKKQKPKGGHNASKEVLKGLVNAFLQFLNIGLGAYAWTLI